MKILYIHQYFNTPKMPGSTRSYEFAKRLVARGDTVYMVTTNWQGKSNLSYTLEEGIHVYWAPLFYNNRMGYLNRVFIFCRFLWYILSLGWKINFDLIIASSTPLTIALPSIFLKKLKGIKLLFEIRDLWPQLPIAIGAIKSSLVIKLAKWLENITYKHSDHIICLSPGMKSELSSIVTSNNITVVTNLSDIFKFQNYDDTQFKINLPINEKKHLVLYAGSFGRINGLLYLVEIANIVNRINKNICFLLVGDGYDKEKIINKSKEYGIYNNSLFCIDYISKDKIPTLFSRATIATSIFLGISEMKNNSANKFFDALAAGKPVMINYGGWQADLIKKTGCGFIIPSNKPENAAKILDKMINNKEKLKEMSKASLTLSQEFSIENNYRKFEQVIDHVTSL